MENIDSLNLVSKLSVDAFVSTGQKVADIGKELSATHLLTGSGENLNGKEYLRLIITDVFRDDDIFHHKYLVDSTVDIQEVLLEILLDINQVLNVEITEKEKLKIKSKKTENKLAYRHYAKGIDAHDWVSLYGTKFYLLAESKKCFRLAIEEDSTFADSYARLASYYIDDAKAYNFGEKRKRLLDSAKMLLDKAIFYDPKLVITYNYYWVYYLEIEEPLKAEKAFNKQIEFAKEKGMKQYEEYLAYYWYYKALGNSCEFIDYFLKYLKYLPPDEFANINAVKQFCFVLMHTGFPKEAKKYANEIYRQNKNHYNYIVRLLMSDWYNLRAESVVEYAEETLLLDSINFDFIYYLYPALIQLEDYKKAGLYMPKLATFRHSFMDSSHITAAKGLYYLKTGNTETGTEIIKKEIKRLEDLIKSNSVNAYNGLTQIDVAGCYSVLGEKDQAFKYLNMLKTMNTYPKVIGARHYIQLKESVFFKDIREKPEFKRILQEVEDTYFQKHQCVEEVLRKYGEIE